MTSSTPEDRADLDSLRCELARLLGPRKPREGVSKNEQWIAAVGEVLIERDQLRDRVRELEEPGRVRVKPARRNTIELPDVDALDEDVDGE